MRTEIKFSSGVKLHKYYLVSANWRDLKIIGRKAQSSFSSQFRECHSGFRLIFCQEEIVV